MFKEQQSLSLYTLVEMLPLHGPIARLEMRH